MIVSKINLDIEIIKLIKTMIFDDVLLINIFSNGVCVTQNINNISNLSIFIDKKYLNIHDINDENSFVTNNIDTLSNLKIEKKIINLLLMTKLQLLTMYVMFAKN